MCARLSEYYDGYFEDKIKTIENLDYSVDFYKKSPGSHISISIPLLENILSAFPHGGTTRILEIGVGTGAMMHWFRHKGFDPVGVDISQHVTNMLKGKGFNMRHHDLNESPLPFSDGIYDLVLSLDVLEHMICPISFMSEIFRVCAPGGHVLISTANSRTLKSIYTLLVKGRFPLTSFEKHGWDCGHLHYFTSRDVDELGKDIGFEVITKKGASLIPGGVKGVIKKFLFAALPSGFTLEFLSGTFVVLLRKPPIPQGASCQT